MTDSLHASGHALAEIGALHTDEGGPYVWVKAAFGRVAAAVATILYWVTVPVWIGGSMAFLAFETWTRFVGHLPEGEWPTTCSSWSSSGSRSHRRS